MSNESDDPERTPSEEAGRPVCVPPLQRSDCQNEGLAHWSAMMALCSRPAVFPPWTGAATAPVPEAYEVVPDEPEPTTAPPTDDEREAAIRLDLAGLEDVGPGGDDTDNAIFLLRRLDEIRAQVSPQQAPARDWTAFSRAPRPPEI